MEFKIVESKEQWFSKHLANYEFLQDWDYGDFLISTGKKIVRYVLQENGIVINGFQANCYQLPFNIKYEYFPRVSLKEEQIIIFLSKLKQKGLTFVKLEPRKELQKMIEQKGFLCKKSQNLQTKYIYLLDIDLSEEKLQERMHSKMRYNLKTAEKRGVVVENNKNFSVFWDLINLTSERQHFELRSRNFLQSFLNLPNVYQFTAYYQNVPLAVALILHNANKIFYVFGASSNEHRNLMAPSLLQWKIITFGKKLGSLSYDMLGIAPIKLEIDEQTSCFNGLCWERNHPLSGVSRFKAGFGGYGKIYPHAFDVILNPTKYHLFKAYAKIRGMKNY